jgi:hypothetical protein
MARKYDMLSITACSLTIQSGAIFSVGFVQLDNNGVLVSTSGDNNNGETIYEIGNGIRILNGGRAIRSVERNRLVVILVRRVCS